jgi:N-acetylmuramoyl-L-alanine amidase
MNSNFRRRILSAVAILVLAALGWWIFRPVPAPPAAKPAPAAHDTLAAAPDWPSLNTYQETITRADFERLLTTVFTAGNGWQTTIEFDDHEARIQTGDTTAPVFHLRFAPPEKISVAPHSWRSAADLPAAPPDQPLSGLKIAIDPGHIGGEWAKIEERWFVIGSEKPVCEGDMTLHVAQLLKPRLEALGATVSLVRDKAEPVTAIRPTSLLTLAQESSPQEKSPATLQKLADRLFYRTAEIHARAEIVNQTLKPDLVLCLHFNAEAWGDPNAPTLIDRSHLHLLLNGAYTDDELQLADQRFALLHKLLQRTHEEEVRVGSSVAATFAQISGLPPYTYHADSKKVRPVAHIPYLWVRNLLANRLYDCPVIFMEPYVMNSTIDYARIQAGDYDGLRDIAGKPRPSIFREYADALAAGLANHYAAARK